MVNPDRGQTRLGRPPKPPEIRRNRRVVTFLAEQDYAELQAMAKQQNMSLSAAANELVIRALHESSTEKPTN